MSQLYVTYSQFISEIRNNEIYSDKYKAEINKNIDLIQKFYQATSNYEKALVNITPQSYFQCIAAAIDTKDFISASNISMELDNSSAIHPQLDTSNDYWKSQICIQVNISVFETLHQLNNERMIQMSFDLLASYIPIDNELCDLFLQILTQIQQFLKNNASEVGILLNSALDSTVHLIKYAEIKIPEHFT